MEIDTNFEAVTYTGTHDLSIGEPMIVYLNTSSLLDLSRVL